MRRLLGIWAAMVIAANVAVGCTVVYTPKPREALKDAAVVFRGAVLKSDVLQKHPEMGSRQRYAVTLRVTEYWKGDRGETILLYDLDPGTDCLGTGLTVGKEYLIFASEAPATDFRLEPGRLWIGWTDVVAAGTPMLRPQTNVPGGDLQSPQVRRWMRQLGKGRRV